MQPDFEQDKQQAIDFARALLSSDDWAILDTETTGLGKTAQIVQVSVIDHSGAVLWGSFTSFTQNRPNLAV